MRFQNSKQETQPLSSSCLRVVQSTSAGAIKNFYTCDQLMPLTQSNSYNIKSTPTKHRLRLWDYVSHILELGNLKGCKLSWINVCWINTENIEPWRLRTTVTQHEWLSTSILRWWQAQNSTVNYYHANPVIILDRDRWRRPNQGLAWTRDTSQSKTKLIICKFGTNLQS